MSSGPGPGREPDDKAPRAPADRDAGPRPAIVDGPGRAEVPAAAAAPTAPDAASPLVDPSERAAESRASETPREELARPGGETARTESARPSGASTAGPHQAPLIEIAAETAASGTLPRLPSGATAQPTSQATSQSSGEPAGATQPTSQATAQSSGKSAGASDLRQAVGAAKDERKAEPATGKLSRGAPGKRMSRRTMLALALLAMLAIMVAALWIAGSQNSRNYYLECGDHQITASRGDSFPPWGTEELGGKKWAAIEIILPVIQCDDQAFGSAAELEAAYRDRLLGQVETWLSSLRRIDPRDKLDAAEAQLEQALLLSRASDEASVQAQQRVSRLLGDVAYWRGQNELDAAKKQLEVALDRFRQAVDKQPVHARDAQAWRAFLMRTMQAIEAGPSAAAEPAPGQDQAGQASKAAPGSAGPGVQDITAQPGATAQSAEPTRATPELGGDAADAGPQPDAGPVQALPQSDAMPAPSITQGSGTLL